MGERAADEPLQQGQWKRKQTRLEFEQVVQSGRFDAGELCVQCNHCAALLWPAQCTKVCAARRLLYVLTLLLGE